MTADIGTGLTARNLTDMRAYINLADFTCALLPLCGPSMFRGWAYLLTLELVSASGQRPLLSGFYRMLKVTMALTAATGILHAGSGGPAVLLLLLLVLAMACWRLCSLASCEDPVIFTDHRRLVECSSLLASWVGSRSS